MSMINIYLLDESEEERNGYSEALNDLFEDTDIRFIPKEPFLTKQEYLAWLAKESISGLILDQKLENGGISYTGAELATFLRSVYSKIPIYILTNHTKDKDAFYNSQKDVECIYSKSDITTNDEHENQVFKARFLRRFDSFNDVIDLRWERFHELLIKSLHADLTPNESIEFAMLRDERIIGFHASEVIENKCEIPRDEIEGILVQLRTQLEELKND